MEKLLHPLKNQFGIALLQSIVFTTLISMAAIYAVRRQKLSTELALKHTFRQSEKSIEESVFHYLSDRKNCETYFDTVTYNGALNFGALNMATIATQWKNVEMISGGRSNFTLAPLVATGDMSLSPNSQIQTTGAQLGIELNAAGAMAGLQSAGANDKINIPLIFEFYRNGGNWSFYSCYAKQARNFVAEASCKLSGGKSDANNEQCTFRTKVFNTAANTLEINEQFNLQNAICKIEDIANKQYQDNHGLNNTGNGIKTSACNAPKWNGCTPTTGPNTGAIGTDGPHVVSITELTQRLEKMAEGGVGPRIARVLNHIDLAGLSTAGLTDAGFATLSGPAGSSSHEIMVQSLSAGAGTSVTATLSGMAILGVGGIAGVVSGLVLYPILRCSTSRRIAGYNQCVNARGELDRISIEFRKFKCKKWSCKCRFEKEQDIWFPNEGRIAKNILNATYIDPLDAPEIPNVHNDEFQASLDALNAENQAMLATTTTFALFYAYASSLAGLEGMSDLSTAELVTPFGDEGASITAAIDQIKADALAKEVSLWSEFTTSVNAINVLSGASALTNWNNKCSIYQSYKFSLRFATPSASTIPAKNALDSKKSSLHTQYTTAKTNATTSRDFWQGQYNARWTVRWGSSYIAARAAAIPAAQDALLAANLSGIAANIATAEATLAAAENAEALAQSNLNAAATNLSSANSTLATATTNLANEMATPNCN